MKNSFKFKLLLPIVAILIISFSVLIVFSNLKFSDFNKNKIDEEIHFTKNLILEELDTIQKNTIVAATSLSKENELIKALTNNNPDTMTKLLADKMELYDITYSAIINLEGNAVSSTDSNFMIGQSYINNQDIESALNGNTLSINTSQKLSTVAIQTSAPIYDENGDIMGVVTSGFQIDSQEFVEKIKEKFNVEFTVFFNDIRSATTIISSNNNSVLGTKISSDVAQTVLGNKQEYIGETDVLGEKYKSVYLPLINNEGIAFAAVSFAILYSDAIAESQIFIIDSVVIGMIALILAVISVYFISSSISKPIVKLTKDLRGLANGNLIEDINTSSQDEVGVLARSILSVSNTVQLLNSEINIIMKNHSEGNISDGIPLEIFKGCYKEIADNINMLVDSTDKNLEDILNCVEELSDGNFNADLRKFPGEMRKVNILIDNMKANLKNVSAEMLYLQTAVINGDLSIRVDSSKYMGDWGKIIYGLNDLIIEVSKPFEQIALSLFEMSKGNMKTRITEEFHGDYQKIKNYFNSTLDIIAIYISETITILTEMANNNFRLGITTEYVGDFNEIKLSINSIIETFNRVLTEISNSTDQISAGSKQISFSSMDLADGSMRQIEAVESLRASLADVFEKVNQTANSASKAKELTDDTDLSVANGKEKMLSMLEAMDKIEESSKSIATIIKVIEDIAFQTNLLALNAAVEAARAGQHGKGFGVVSQEVRSLASKSQRAAKETNDLINSTIEKINDGVRIASETADDLDTISEKISLVSDLVKTISADTVVQVKSIEQSNEQIKMISDVTSSNSAHSEETAAASEELASQANIFKDTVGRFELF